MFCITIVSTFLCNATSYHNRASTAFLKLKFLKKYLTDFIVKLFFIS